MVERRWAEYRPVQAPHVRGEYEAREIDPLTGHHEPQHVRATCERCGESWQMVCETGMVRGHVDRFAIVSHLHR